MAATFAAQSLAVAAPALADETAPPSAITITGAATFASQCRFRGVAQSDNGPVVQGTITIAHSSGFYVTIWASIAATSTPIPFGPVTAKVGANLAPAQNVFNYTFTSPHRGNTYVYAELGGAIPGAPLSVHSHIAHTGSGFDFPKEFIDYNVGITARYKNLALDASVVGTSMTSRDCAGSGLCNEASSPAQIATCANVYDRTTKPVGVVSLTASF